LVLEAVGEGFAFGCGVHFLVVVVVFLMMERGDGFCGEVGDCGLWLLVVMVRVEVGFVFSGYGCGG
jgi:hypothetical protein